MSLLREALLLGRHAEYWLVGSHSNLDCNIIWWIGLSHRVAQSKQHQREPDDGNDTKESTASHAILDDFPLAFSTPLRVLDLCPPLTLSRKALYLSLLSRS